ncbi:MULTISPECIES: hypothetical protein [Methylobacterium]|uniref:hypothetical protein n=1 Tax=Methylobacterium TaxID=407 RepID=UPI0013EBDDA7|nr:hypothetical protein [Methylobacterium sp. DB0501]NGM35958.1 hypothetical protein [Methylobacterium sp. DB0501]
MAASGHETAPPSLVRRTSLVGKTWRMALVAVALSLAATQYLASRRPAGSGPGATAALRGGTEPETTGSIAGSAAGTRLDPCAATPRP